MRRRLLKRRTSDALAGPDSVFRLIAGAMFMLGASFLPEPQLVEKARLPAQGRPATAPGCMKLQGNRRLA